VLHYRCVAKPYADWPVLTFSFEAKRLTLNIIMFKGNTKIRQIKQKIRAQGLIETLACVFPINFFQNPSISWSKSAFPKQNRYQIGQRQNFSSIDWRLGPCVYMIKSINQPAEINEDTSWWSSTTRQISGFASLRRKRLLDGAGCDGNEDGRRGAGTTRRRERRR
jgi:hypothetical protein